MRRVGKLMAPGSSLNDDRDARASTVTLGAGAANLPPKKIVWKPSLLALICKLLMIHGVGEWNRTLAMIRQADRAAF